MNPNDRVSLYLQLQYLFVLCKSGGFFPDAWCLKSTEKQLHVIYKYHTDRTSKACKVALAHHRRVGVHHFMPVWKTQAVHRRQGVVPSVGCRQRLPTSTGALWGTTLRELGECDESKCTWCIRLIPWKHILPMDLRAESLRPAQYCSLLITFAHRVRMLGARTGEDAKDPGANEIWNAQESYVLGMVK